jgi:hypothetical protein
MGDSGGTMIKSKSSTTKNNAVITCQLLQPYAAKYLVIVADRGMTGEVNYFNSLKEAKRAFCAIAHNHGYKPSEINGSDKYDVSIWEWIEDRYEKIYYYA